MRRLAADVVVIGAGVVGCAVARELSKFDIRVILVEKQADVASGTTKSNTALVHAGFDADPGSWKAKLNVRGTALYPRITSELGASFKNTGSLVVAVEEDQVNHLHELKARGDKNGVPALEIVDHERIRELEPNISPNALAALWAPSAGITCPWELTIALAENAVENGVEILLETPVVGIEVRDGRAAVVKCPDVEIEASYVVNAAGLYSDDVARMVTPDPGFEITPRKGEYYLYDRRVGSIVGRPLFPVPTKFSKGIVVAPTVDGNMLAGPNSQLVDDKHDLATTAPGLAEVMSGAVKLIPNMPTRESITNFAGLRAVAKPANDFVMGPIDDVPNFINAAGIQSPGLSAAPAIAEQVRDFLADAGLELREKPSFNPVRKRPARFIELTREEQAQLVAKDPMWGHIICRCETVTEAEIVEALHRPVPCTTVDGVKRRTRAGMGRCQGGFCGPRVVAIISRELGIDIESVTKKGGQSNMVDGRTKDAALVEAAKEGVGPRA